MAYAARSDVEDVFGVSNVSTWADLDNDEDSDKITARITRALTWAEAYIDGRLLNGPYGIPFSSAPTVITDATATFAGVWLYEGRGVDDYDASKGKQSHNLQWHRQRAEDVLNKVLDGRLTFAISPEVEDFPVVVK